MSDEEDEFSLLQQLEENDEKSSSEEEQVGEPEPKVHVKNEPKVHVKNEPKEHIENEPGLSPKKDVIESDDSLSSDEESVDDDPKEVYDNTPLCNRDYFRFCMWLMLNHDDVGQIRKFKEYLKNTIQQLLKIDDFKCYLIYNNKERDRIRVFCPEIIVTVKTFLDIRNVILGNFKYKKKSVLIPNILYKFPITPDIYIPRIYDIGLIKYESNRTYTCLDHKKMKTEELEKLMIKWSMNDKDMKETEFTEDYVNFLDQEILYSDDDDETFLEDREVSEQIKKDLGKNYDNCVNWFKSFHPDSILNHVKDLDNHIYLFDFSKSNRECKICKVVHKSNRQYLTFSNYQKKVHYKCYDTDASGKRKEKSFATPKAGSSVNFI